MDEFYNTHILNTDDPTVIVLKSHLYIESCLDNFLSMVLPTPDKILKKSFSNKIDIFEALNLGHPPDNPKIVLKLRQINKMRNNLAHNLNNQPNLEDISALMNDISSNSDVPISVILKRCFTHFISYFHALLSLNELIPFLWSYVRNEEIFKKDIGWNDKILLNYPIEDAGKILEFLKIK